MMSWKQKEVGELKARVNLLEAEKLAEEENERNAEAVRAACMSSIRVNAEKKERELEQVRRDLS